ncbi:MAG: dienelactone hydrolase family protein [Salinivirgaceae bacterium]|jgi:dienelactone hydrolase|nr:dienelactone hydrolase family protein [Salinivirgaceae bacterium]
MRPFIVKSSLLFACMWCMQVADAQTKTAAQTELQALYGDVVPGKSQPLNTLSNIGIILPDTKADDWPEIRAKIYKRIETCLGQGPVELKPAVNKFEEIERYQNNGFTHIKYRYQIFDDIWNEAIVVLPAKFQYGDKSSAILTIHGTNGKSGKMGALGAPGGRRAYALELANKGYITFAPDIYGFGASINNTTQAALIDSILKKYPNWSYRGIKILGLIRAIDMLEQLPFVKKGSYGSMGNSLGGGMALYHAAFDTRIKVSVPSTGVSPANTNVYRLLNSGITSEEPERWKKIAKDGKPPYDIHEIIALCAPRCMLFLEDYNDPYNPDVMASFQHVYQAMQVYQLLGTPGHISMLIHGDGHDTVDDVREYAYKWFDRYLLTKNK